MSVGFVRRGSALLLATACVAAIGSPAYADVYKSGGAITCNVSPSSHFMLDGKGTGDIKFWTNGALRRTYHHGLSNYTTTWDSGGRAVASWQVSSTAILDNAGTGYWCS